SWQKYNGHPSMFGSAPTTAASTQDPQNAPDQAGVPTPAPAGASAANAETVPGGAPQAQQAAAAEKVVVTTDVLRLTFDTLGAQIVKAELLKHADNDDEGRPIVLLDDSAQRVYLAQTGVVGAPAGASYPTHRTPFRVTTPARELNGDKLEISFEAESAGVKVIKTFTLHKGQYAIDVRHTLENVSADPVS